MKLKEFMEKMPHWRDDDRTPIKGLMAILSPLSLGEIMNFQRDWDGSRPYEEFVVEQNKVLDRCIKMETSEIGRDARFAMELPPITYETEVPA